MTMVKIIENNNNINDNDNDRKNSVISVATLNNRERGREINSWPKLIRSDFNSNSNTNTNSNSNSNLESKKKKKSNCFH